MAKQWEAGTIGYDEIFLPTACVKLGPGACRLQSLHHSTVAQHHGGAHGEKSHPRLTEHFRYKPEHGCEEFLRAAAAKASNLSGAT